MESWKNQPNNSKIKDIIYSCKKKVFLPNYMPSLCKWNGVLDEYIRHVKNEHHTCFFSIPKTQKFEWKLPFVGDQTDKGILKQDSNFFLYEIHYNANFGQIYFSLTQLNHQDNLTSYNFSLFKDKLAKVSFDCDININFPDLLKPIQEGSREIVINNNFVLESTDKCSRVLQWYVTIK